MSDKHPNPHHQQAPVHDSEEAKPGLDSLAPDDQEWRPTPKPTAPGAEPTAPGSLKAPETHSSKLDALEPQRKGGEDYPLTTNQGRTYCRRSEFATRRRPRPNAAGRFHSAGEDYPL